MSSPDGPARAPVCPTCGTPVGGEARFCRRCGDPLPGALPAPSAEGSPASTAPPATGDDPAPPIQDVATAAMDAEAVAAVAADPLVAHGGTRRDPTEQSSPVVVATSPPDGIACPACALVNPRGRELCVRCGVDLETGDTLPQPRPSPGDGGSDAVGLPPEVHRAWWIAPLAIVGVAAAILAGLWAAGIGPFASQPELPSADFVADRYPVDDDPQHLVLTDIATVTTRPPEGQRTFPVEQMVDTDQSTAWHSYPDNLPEGVAEKVDLFLDEPAWVAQIVINNGDHADPAAYEAAGRIQRAVLVMDGDVHMEIVLLDLGREPQAVTLPEPVLTTTVRLEILDVVPGSEVDGVAISDLELRGWPADETDADIAMRRADVRQAAGSFTVPG